LVAFILSAGRAGFAGATRSVVFQFASLTDVHWSMSGEVVLITVVGGMEGGRVPEIIREALPAELGDNTNLLELY
jgi:hypothetical protein